MAMRQWLKPESLARTSKDGVTFLDMSINPIAENLLLFMQQVFGHTFLTISVFTYFDTNLGKFDRKKKRDKNKN